MKKHLLLLLWQQARTNLGSYTCILIHDDSERLGIGSILSHHHLIVASLYYARSLALLHHGKLFANNRKDCQGAVFTLAIPTHEEIYSDAEKRNLEEEQKMELSAKKDSMIANKIEQEDGSDNRPKVLIVDDDTEVVHYLRTLLATDYHVIYRFDAESALKAIREEEPSLILSDVVMPGISGYELCKAIKQELANSELDVNKATELMHISRTKLYYKVKGLTGENPSVFFKTYKLNRAAALARGQSALKQYIQ